MFAVIASLPEEMALLTAAMEPPAREEYAGLEFVRGRIAGREVAAVVCGVGKVNGARTAQTLIDRYAPEAIIHTGVAGSLDARAAHLGLVVSTELCYHDMDDDWLLTSRPFTKFFPADPALRAALVAAAEEAGGAIEGRMATGDRFIDDSAVKREIAARSGGLCVDMELAATAHVACLNGVRYCAIKCISDLAEDPAGTTFETFLTVAADKAAGTVLRMLQRLER